VSMTVEQLLATLGIDSAEVTVSPSGRYVLIQRDPQPDETDIPITTDVIFMLVDLDGAPNDPGLVTPAFDFYVDGNHVLSFVGGVPVWTAPWTGVYETHTPSSPYAFWKFTSQQPGTLFTSEQEVPVQLDLLSGGGWGHAPWGHFPWGHIPAATPAQTYLYSFTIEDLTPPKLISAQGIDPFTVRVTFDDDMALSGTSSALDLANWANTIQRWNVDPLPGVTLDVTGVVVADVVTPYPVPVAWVYANATARTGATGFVEDDVGKIAFQESDSTYWMLIDTSPTWLAVEIGAQFDLTVNWEMTPDCPYEITANPNLEDDAGNTMDPSYSSAAFPGFAPEIPEGRAFSHWEHMIPAKNKREDLTRDLERTSNCIEEVLAWMMYYVDRFTDQFDPDKATDEQIDAMLYDMGNPFSAWTELELTANQKRKLLRILIEIYKSKGTAWGIEQTIFFLLGEVVHVVPYLQGGWVLGEDALGSGAIAEVMNDTAAPWDFTAVSQPWELTLKIDGGAEQTITFIPGHFANPAAATADEVIAVIVAQLSGGSAYELYPGQSAVAAGTSAEPFAVSPGDTLSVLVDGDPTPLAVTLAVADIATPGAATASELAAAISNALVGFIVGHDVAGRLALETVERSDAASIEVQAGSVQVATGLPTAVQNGSDLPQISIYSNKAGVSASVEITGGVANDVLGFNTEFIGSTGGAVLAPDDQYTLYSFDIETENVLTSEQTAIVRRVAEYMKVAHEHLIDIRTAEPLPWPDAWVLGVDELDVSTELAE